MSEICSAVNMCPAVSDVAAVSRGPGSECSMQICVWKNMLESEVSGSR